MVRVARWYSKRIVNVNVNVVVSGLLAGVLTVIPVHLTRYVGINGETAITAVAMVSDIVFDVLIYYVLHWVANHMPHKYRHHPPPGVPRLNFMRDATLVQFERALLAPVYYGIFLGLLHLMLTRGVPREVATFSSLACGILTTRVLHTFWMLRQERRQRLLAMGRAESLASDRTIPAPSSPPGAMVEAERRSGAA